MQIETREREIPDNNLIFQTLYFQDSLIWKWKFLKEIANF